MGVSITTNDRELLAAVERFAGVLNQELLQEAFVAGLSELQAAIMRSTVERLAKDPTGALARSWEVEAHPEGDRVVAGKVVSALPYARIHDTGGTIRPTRGQYLAIPLRPPIPVGARGLMPRNDTTPMAAWRSKRGNLILWQTGRGAPVPRYLLVKEVRIVPTEYLRQAVEDSKKDVQAAFTTTLTRALERAAAS